jgi:hypothetical protein
MVNVCESLQGVHYDRRKWMTRLNQNGTGTGMVAHIYTSQMGEAAPIWGRNLFSQKYRDVEQGNCCASEKAALRMIEHRAMKVVIFAIWEKGQKGFRPTRLRHLFLNEEIFSPYLFVKVRCPLAFQVFCLAACRLQVKPT